MAWARAMRRAVLRAGVAALVLTVAGGATACGSKPPPPRATSAAATQARRQFCRDVRGPMLAALNAAADDRTTNAQAVTLFGSARAAFARDARLRDPRVRSLSIRIVHGLDGFIGVVRSHGLQRALDEHADEFGGAAFEVDRFCG
jgi:hypothetical protein